MNTEHAVVLTGATGGIGQAIAKRLAESGKPLVLVGRNTDKLKTLAASLQGQFATADINLFECDIANREQCQALLKFLESLPVQVDTLVNNAGINDFALFEDQSDETVSELIQVNVTYPLLLTRDFLRWFAQRGQAAQIINIGSTFGSIGYPGFAVYSASKFALRGATEALAREYADSTVALRYFAPRATRTTMNNDQVMEMNEALKVKMDEPDVVAGELLQFMNSNKASHYVGWPEKLFVRINQLFPGLVSASVGKALPVIRQYAGSSGTD